MRTYQLIQEKVLQLLLIKYVIFFVIYALYLETIRTRYTDEYLKCVHDATNAECGTGAAQFEKKMAHLEVGPLLESLGCGK